MNTEGTLHILWSNNGEPTATPRYMLTFGAYNNPRGGAQQTKQIIGTQALEAYLNGITIQDVAKWIKEVHANGSASIPNLTLADEQLTPYLAPSA